MSEPSAVPPIDFLAHAVVGSNGDAELVVDGDVHRFSAASVGEAGGMVTEFIARLAADQGRPLSLRIEDPDGKWLLTIHPNGTVEEAASPAPEHRGRRAEAGPPQRVQPELPEPPAPRAETTAGWSQAPAGPVRVGVLAPPGPRPQPSAPAASAVLPGQPALPTLEDLLATRPEPPAGPAEWGWRRTVRHLTFGAISPRPGPSERRHRDAIHSVQRSLDGPKTIVVLNPKGGAHKTTTTLMIAATFGIHRGGYTLAWDNNETRGTLGWRSAHSRHGNTAVSLLNDLGRFRDLSSARVGDLDNYVRSQGSAQFDVLASDEDAASAASIDEAAFTALHRTLVRFYRVMVIDTGNNMRASNWQAAVKAADQLVIVSTVREDTAQSAAWAIDALRATGHEDMVRRAVTVLSAPGADVDAKLRARLHDHFGQLTRVVLDVPHDPALVAGGPLVVDALQNTTREAWLQVTAAVAEGL
jgi:MinD-like ATPase involved in chromosome partitioning or flagellar assembly